jgi:hypothetical protein
MAAPQSVLQALQACNIRQYPDPEDIAAAAHLPILTDVAKAMDAASVGDMHGNSMKLLHIAIRLGLITLEPQLDGQGSVKAPQALYVELSGIYARAAIELTDEDFLRFKQIVDQFAAGPNANTLLLRLIGDLLADRGSNDMLTLLVLDKFRELRLKYCITASNHDREFIANLEGAPFVCSAESQSSLDEADSEDESDSDSIDSIEIERVEDGSEAGGRSLLHPQSRITNDAQTASLLGMARFLQAQTRAGRAPPEGFDSWVNYAKALFHRAYVPYFKLLDYEYDLPAVDAERASDVEVPPARIQSRLYTHAVVDLRIVGQLFEQFQKQFPDFKIPGIRCLADVYRGHLNIARTVDAINQKAQQLLREGRFCTELHGEAYTSILNGGKLFESDLRGVHPVYFCMQSRGFGPQPVALRLLDELVLPYGQDLSNIHGHHGVPAPSTVFFIGKEVNLDQNNGIGRPQDWQSQSIPVYYSRHGRRRRYDVAPSHAKPNLFRLNAIKMVGYVAIGVLSVGGLCAICIFLPGLGLGIGMVVALGAAVLGAGLLVGYLWNQYMSPKLSRAEGAAFSSPPVQERGVRSCRLQP